MKQITLAAGAALFLFAGCSSSRPVAEPAAAEAASKTTASASKDKDNGDELKPYAEVITEAAESDDGLFDVHKVGEKYYYEIPDSLLGAELLLVSRIARTADDIGYGGEKANTQVIRWQRKDNKVLLRVVGYQNVADEDEPISEAVRNSNFEPIIVSFDVESLGKDSTGVVIEVTDFFTGDVASIGLPKFRRDRYKVRRLDGDRSFINTIHSYPQNVEVRHVLTYDASEPPSNSSTGSISLEMSQSMILLPADPMQPRLCDDRVGFFSIRQVDYGLDAQRAEQRCYITRWRLEPSDPAAFARGELVEPVKKIVYYVDPATPLKWRPFIKQGVDDWNVAFEAAGFKNAIEGRYPPTADEDPEFSPEDVRYSVIRYFSSDVQNAYGPHVSDPRTGEILESDIGWFHNVMNLLRNWFFVQTSAINPDARGVRFEDEVMGRLIRFVSAHEVGHTLGLPHNWGSSVAYPVDSLRSATFTRRMGTAPSIMDYARFNYVAQPGDGDVGLMPQVGPYDKWSVEWGYRPIPAASSPDQERETLNGWVTQRAGDPLYFYGRQSGRRVDPRAQSEDLGDDAVKASEYGLANLKRIVPQLINWTTEDAHDYDQLQELYGQVVGQWNRYIGHVSRQIGGIYETPKTADQDGLVYQPVSRAKQEGAMAFLATNVWSTPDWLLDEEVLRRIQHAGFVDRVRALQVGSVNLLLEPERIGRLMEIESVYGVEPYRAIDLLSGVRTALFSEYPSGDADRFRRALQRGYLARMEFLMSAEVQTPSSSFARLGFTPINVEQSDIRPMVRGELTTLRADLQRALRFRHDVQTRLHLQDLTVRIDDILDPED